MIRVGIKYCGGCNPGYDRVALVETLKRRLAGRMEFVPYDAGNVDKVVAVEGCPTACADLNGIDNCEIIIIKSPEEADRVIQTLKPE